MHETYGKLNGIKGKVRPVSCHERSPLYLNLVLVGWWLMPHPGHFTPVNDLISIVYEAEIPRLRTLSVNFAFDVVCKFLV